MTPAATPDPPWQTLYAAAERAVVHELWVEAEELLSQVLQLLPDHASAHHLLGKVLEQQDELEGALAAQQRSCALDPTLGWNWFAAGELLLELERPAAAAEAFDQALAALPAEGWIRHQATEARLALHCGGERLSAGLGPLTYRHWIAQHEPRLPSTLAPPTQPFWLLEPLANGESHWRALHSAAPLQPRPAPLGQSPWPADGWLVLLGADTQLRPGALQAIESWMAGGLPEQRPAQALAGLNPRTPQPLPQPDLLYADEDQLDGAGQRCEPWFKPGWVEESFWSSPWLEALSVWRLSWLRHQQLPLPPADQEGRWRWQLSALERRPQIQHVPLVLAHRRGSPQPASQPMAEALAEHLRRQGEAPAAVQPHRHLPGCFQLSWSLPAQWSCSVIIPTRDRPDLLAQCLESLWQSTARPRANGLELELLVVDNGSVEAATQALLQHWQQQLGKRFRVLRDDGPFNWSRLNNQAAAAAKGELLLLLNNDIEARQPGWLEAMAAQALRPHVGAVGAVLLYPDGSIQHGGVVVGMHSGADHAYRNLELEHGVHRGRSRLLTGWGAVTGACLMLRRELLERLGGLDEGLPVEFNDVDLCLRLGQLGYRQMIPPEAVLVHHESQSRDAQESATAQEALKRVQQRWGLRLAHAGPWWPAQSERNCGDGRPVGLEGLPD